MNQAKIEELLALIIVRTIKNAIMEAFAALEGNDSKYYRELFLELKTECQKIAEISGLPLEAVEAIATLIGQNAAAEIAKELVISDFQYNKENEAAQSYWKNNETSKEAAAKERHKERSRNKEKERSEQEIEEETKEEKHKHIRDSPSAQTLARLATARDKKRVKETLKALLFSMIAHRMDPRQRAGETARSNVKYANLYGRGGQLSIGQLLKAGVVTGAVLKELRSHGIGHNAHVSLHKIQHIIREHSHEIFSLLKTLGHSEHSLVKIPNKEQGTSVLSNVNKSLGIFSPAADQLKLEVRPKPDLTPYVAKSQDQGCER